MKLKLGLQRVGSIVFGRVLEQRGIKDRAEIGRYAGHEAVNYLSTVMGGPCFCSSNIVCCLCLRGSNASKNNDWFAYDFGDKETAIQAVKDIKSLVKMVNSDEETKEMGDCGLEIIE